MVDEGVDAVAMHGDKSQSQREKALARFERGEVDILVATDVAARGIDLPDLGLVVHAELPREKETLLTGVTRDGWYVLEAA